MEYANFVDLLVRDYYTNGRLLFWSSVWNMSVTSSIPLIVFFLTLDRILFISFPIKYNERHKLIVVLASVVVVALGMVGNLIALFEEVFLAYIPGIKRHSCYSHHVQKTDTHF
uniref:G-protein coupled receptors family 1 profile domain-containing protein n=1 Tax=Ditylenchus dipsaci TaxID=166011 RepID=A0A915CMU7_9BILA